ncbi:MAG: N-acetylglucosamine-6-phosphate deacetylase [Ruminococcus sp.]|nr:N-acetylglucosamine-6-phosphate deacetylase [Ruminococcus sp.]
MKTVLKNGLVFTEDGIFRELEVEFDNGVITCLGEGCQGQEVDCSGCYVLPGLTDVHFHGCNGADLCDGDTASLSAMAQYEFSRGITSICPATMTLPEDRLRTVISCAAEYSQAGHINSACLLGLHLEGPFISVKNHGAQSAEDISLPHVKKLRYWQELSGGLIKLVTIAPEVQGALECISQCSEEFHFSVGHTNATYDECIKAFELGADHVTHLFNAMPAFHHRETRVIGAALDNRECFVELISDGIHCSPTAVRAAFTLFGDDRIVLISDSTEATGMPDGEYTLGGEPIIKRSGAAFLKNGGLAGSTSDLYDCFIRAVSFGIPLESAIKAATINPCRSIGAHDLWGSIRLGKAAHFLILRKEDLSIFKVI